MKFRSLALLVIIASELSSDAMCAELPYVVVGTGQSLCYNNDAAMEPPMAGQRFYGQDAQYLSKKPAYKLSQDGRTVHDLNTGLIWQRGPDVNGDGAPTREDKLSL